MQQAWEKQYKKTFVVVFENIRLKTKMKKKSEETQVTQVV